MLTTIKNAWKIAEVRKKIIFTLLMLVVFRLAAHIPVPGISKDALTELFKADIWTLMDTFSGGSLKYFTVCAMGIMPYINASIIMNLLTIAIPYFENLAREGQEGRKKMARITRYGAVGLALVQSIGMTFMIRSALVSTSVFSYMVIILTLTAGTCFLMWLGELITENGIGNGISLIIFVGILASLPNTLFTITESVRGGQTNIITVILFVVLAILIIAGVVFIQEAQRRIPVQYAKRMVGRRVYGGQASHIPMKVNQTGVIPIIFAMSLLMLPSTIAGFFPNNGFATMLAGWFMPGSWLYIMLYIFLIIFFTYFYTAVTFNCRDIAENMQKNGGFIPGIRPGKPTSEYLDGVLTRLTLAGAIFLSAIAVMPFLAAKFSGLDIYFGGTSLLIVVGVALDTMKQLEAQVMERQYSGFMK